MAKLTGKAKAAFLARMAKGRRKAAAPKRAKATRTNAPGIYRRKYSWGRLSIRLDLQRPGSPVSYSTEAAGSRDVWATSPYLVSSFAGDPKKAMAGIARWLRGERNPPQRAKKKRAARKNLAPLLGGKYLAPHPCPKCGAGTRGRICPQCERDMGRASKQNAGGKPKGRGWMKLPAGAKAVRVRKAGSKLVIEAAR